MEREGEEDGMDRTERANAEYMERLGRPVKCITLHAIRKKGVGGERGARHKESMCVRGHVRARAFALYTLVGIRTPQYSC